jgi:signal transduction histidine kinase
MPQQMQVLIVEDNPADAELLVRELRRSGLAFDWQRVDTEADYLAKLSSSFHLILSDFEMPEFNGRRALELLKQQPTLDIPFIIVSGTIGEEMAVAVMREGAADYLLKDRITRLAPAVRRALQEVVERSERKAAEREIQALNQNLEARVIERTAELKASNKEMEAFTYSVSHDLRAPLRHIGGFTKILLEKYRPTLPPDAQELLGLIAQGASRMGQMVDEMLKLAHTSRQALQIERTGLSSLVEDVVTLLSPEIEGRQVQWKIGELPFVECDPVLIRQVFQNLIDNALKYSQPRSPAVIEVGHAEIEGEEVIFVKDNGVGFEMKYADKLFGVFQRLHLQEEFEGTGIGLATVERIVQKHGGRVWAQAELNRGATFYFTLGGLGRPAPEEAARQLSRFTCF